MSAWICEPEHIGFLAAWYRTFSGYSDFNCGEVAGILAEENIRSVKYRYGSRYEDFSDDQYIHECMKEGHNQFKDLNKYSLAQVLKWAHCYAYQACEHPAWEQSTAKQICDRIESAAIRQIPGYKEAHWGWPDAD
jgi:hypothetical protein